jgi:hypothetical protein
MWNPPDRYAHTAQLKQAPYFASFQTNSWGNYDAEENQYTSLSAQMDDIIWKLDIAILNGQGNFGTFGSLGQAIAKNIISVGGIAHHDTLSTSDDTWAVTGFRDPASIGPAQDGRVKPDISYWYDAIYTTDAEPGGYSAGLYTFPPNFAGTSAATPESAGVLGLMLQMWKENVWGTNHPPEMTVFEAQPHFSTLKALLINNAQQYPFSGEGHDLSRYHQGWGRPSVRIAKERAARSFIVNQSVLLEVGELATYRINVASGEPELKVTMVYPDPPGNPASSIARVNDLDLRVISPSGVVYHGNVGLISGNASVPGGAANRIDTVENVFVVSPETGTWTVAVEAAEINEDACPVGHPSTCGPTPGGTPEADATFSLVVTGGTGGSACTAPTANITAAPNPVRVGQAVQFQGNASGGAGGPYSYWWDVDGDGAPDSTVADAVHTYPRPFAGSVSLWVADAANCPVTVHETVTVTGPDLRYDSHVGLTEVEGNGNGGIDPGETWELTVNLRNDGSEPALGVSADLMSDPGSAVPVTFLQASSTYADIPVGAARTSARAYRFRVDSPAPCGEWISFGLVARLADPAYSYPTEAGVIRLLVGATGPAMTIFYDDFEQLTNWGWPGDEHGNDCEIDIPRGLGGPLPDPSGGYDGPHVLGNDLTGVGFVPGNYENDVFTHCISPVFEFSRFVHLSVSYARWLNVSYGDWAYLDLFHGLGQPNGTRQRVHTWSGTADSSWVVDSFDISDYADGRNPIRLSFEIMSDSQATSSGWNIDAFEVRGVPLESCEPYVPATGPDLRYDSHVALTEVDGNGNGGIDPGETWELTVKLRNVGNEPAVGVSADLVPDAGSLVSVTMLQAGSTYADIPVGATTLSDRAYRFRVDSSAPCGAWISIGLAARTTDPANSYPTQVGVIRLWVGGTGPAVTVFYDNFEGAPYLRQGSVTHPAWWWSEGEYSEWQIDTPRGLGGPMPDPNGGYDGPHVLGNDLTGLGVVHGNYETDGVFSSTVESITLDLSQYKELSLSLARWLNVGAGDRATFDVNNNTVFSSTDAADSSWKLEMFDISNFAVGGVSFRFNIDSDAQGTASGWNIDAFEVRGVPLDSCEPYVPDTTPPSVAITSPTENANVSGTVDVTVNASDNAGVARVDLYRDGTLIGTDSSSPYAISWNTTNETIGSHTLMAYAYDTSNLSTSSSPVHVNVSCNAVGATGLTVTKAGGTNVLLTWTAVSGATSFDVVRGGLSALRSTHGDFNTATQACSANNTTATSLTTSEGLTPGNGYWYLVRGSTCGAAGTYDDGTQVASRDAGINASGNRSCP